MHLYECTRSYQTSGHTRHTEFGRKTGHVYCDSGSCLDTRFLISAIALKFLCCMKKGHLEDSLLICHIGFCNKVVVGGAYRS